MPPAQHLARIEQSLAPLRARLLSHPVYEQIRDLRAIQQFMEHHVYAVWDFMSLLKALQKHWTCVAIPWLPAADAVSARLINEIVLGEESDLDRTGRPASHFELYRDAMREAGADGSTMDRFLDRLRADSKLSEALFASEIPPAAARFVRATFEIIDSGSQPEIASAFAFGREDLLPHVFRNIVTEVHARMPGHLAAFVYYLDRHIALDGEEHGPLAMKLVERVCGENEEAWQRAEAAAVRSLQARVDLWNAMSDAIATSIAPHSR